MEKAQAENRVKEIKRELAELGPKLVNVEAAVKNYTDLRNTLLTELRGLERVVGVMTDQDGYATGV